MAKGVRRLGALLLVCSSVSADTCEDEIQRDCLFARVGSLTNQTDRKSCLECAKAHEADLLKVCNSTQQVEDFCQSPKPVLGGYDVVQYFSLNENDPGVMGSSEFTHTFTSPDKDGSPRFTHEFWFSAADNRDKFAADPWKYAPKNGGY